MLGRVRGMGGIRGIATSALRLTESQKAARFVRPVDRATLPRGYAVSATYAGIKAAISPKLTAPGGTTSNSDAPKAPPKPDLALLVSAYPTATAGVFTQNVFKAAPVQFDAGLLADGKSARAILVNSGCANAVTGQQGLEDVHTISKEVTRLLTPATRPAPSSSSSSSSQGPHESIGETYMLSTGVIGVPLPVKTISRSLPHLASGMILRNDPEAWDEVSRAFMTTDSFPKLRTRTFTLHGVECRLAGIAKGAGMIHPSMGPLSKSQLHATLLSVIVTDAPVSAGTLQGMLEEAVSRSFNCISVDGDMSTNDTVLALANGAAAKGTDPDGKEAGWTISADKDPEAHEVLLREFTALCTELSQLLVRDGEGANKFVHVRVSGTPTRDQAHAIASSISTSALVKTALHGEDANWGRILCAAGYAPIPPFTPQGDRTGLGSPDAWSINPAKVTVRFVLPTGLSPAEKEAYQPLVVLKKGVPQKVDEDAAARLLSLEDVAIEVDLEDGPGEADFWTCDLSKEYVAINGDYRS